MRRALTSVAVPLLLAVLAGCGSSGSSGSSSSASTPSTPAPAASTPASSTPGSGKTVDVTYQNIAIQPANITVKVGDKIKWTNKDNVTHNVVGQSGPIHVLSPDMNQGATYEVTATSPGVVHYFCSIHPTAMIGTITITK